MPTFMLVSVILCLAGVPMFATAEFLMTRHLADPLIAASAWLYLAVAYWWPLGAWLFHERFRLPVRLVLGYVLSVPLYFAGLWVSYAAIGYHFAPENTGMWFTYLSVSPWFYLYVVLLWLLVRRPRAALVVRRIAAAVAVTAVAVPIVALAGIDRVGPARSTPVTRITNARVVDPMDGLLPGLRDVVIADGRIAGIEAALSPSPSAGSGQTIDADGAYLVPGLIDVHVHLQTPAASINSFSLRYAGGEVYGNYRDHRVQLLANGVTSVRDTGGAAAVSQRLRQALQDGNLAGPRLFTVARLITSPEGHPVTTIWPRTLAAAGAIQASDPAAMLQEIERDFAEYRPDALKVIDGTIGRAPTLLGSDVVAAAVAAAQRHGVPSIVHVERASEMLAAVRAGATGVEHAASVTGWSDTLFDAVVRHRPFVDPTFGEYRVVLRQGGRRASDIEDALVAARSCIKRLADAGAPIVVGTDAPLVAFGSGLHDELRELERAGFSAADILRIVTINNAAYLGHPRELGRIAPGFRADLVLLSQNPLEQLAALRRPLWTMVGGRVMWETRAVQP
jgi:imidazolonepropionase-like amidohydrolase